MSRYIDADVLLKHFDSAEQIGFGIIETAIVKDFIINEPTADVVGVKHGRWIKDRLCSTSGGTYGVRRCSVCEHYFQDLVNEYNYCPNCGADMRGGDAK